MKIILRAFKKPIAWPFQQMELSSFTLELIFPFQFIVLTVPLSQVWTDRPMSHPWLWIDEKNRLYCCETLPNTRLKYTHHAVFVPLWATVTPILRTAFSCQNFQSICDVQYFLKCLRCLLARALLVDGSSIPFCEFSSPFLSWSPHLVDHSDVRLGSSYDLVQTPPPNTFLLSIRQVGYFWDYPRTTKNSDCSLLYRTKLLIEPPS